MSFHRFLIGHVLDALRSLSDESVHCVVTSPPYWGLRDYGLPPASWPEIEYAPMPGLPSVRIPAWEGCLGLEPAPEMYVGHLVLIFREVRRVLRKDGTLWLNLGDSYAGSWGNYHPYSPPGKHGQRLKETARWNRRAYDGREDFLPPTARLSRGLKEKDLVGIPWRAAFALQGDGWYLRSDIIWNKLNCLPESVKDRCTKAHEYVFMLAKSVRYHYDCQAVKEPLLSGSEVAYRQRIRSGKRYNTKQPYENNYPTLFDTTGRNRRSVWEINTEPFPGAHFAVFPKRLAELCILAGTSPKACPICGAPWRRVVEKEKEEGLERPAQPQKHLPEWGRRESGTRGNRLADVGRFSGKVANMYWQPTCCCSGNEGSGWCTVLDPFGGAGTTTLVAMELGRDSIYIDLKREYAEMALKRCGFGDTLLDCHAFEVAEIPAAAEVPA